MDAPHELELALFSCGLLGLRHGFDYDHIAAISDIASVQRNWKEGMRLGSLYALGHAATVALLGSAVVFLHISLPAHMNSWAGRLVGLTLIALAVYVLFTWTRHGHTHNGPKSRLALLITGVRWLHWRALGLFRYNSPRPPEFSWNYDVSSVFMIGVVHGLGAETPSQLLLFLLAANLGGTSRGFLGLLTFLIGLLMMNTAMTASASGFFRASSGKPRVQSWITVLTASYSLVVGLIFLIGASGNLPPLGN